MSHENMRRPFTRMNTRLYHVFVDDDDQIDGGLPAIKTITARHSDNYKLISDRDLPGTLQRLAARTRRFVDSVQPIEPSLETVRAAHNTDRVVVKRGVRMRNITAFPDRGTPLELQMDSELRELGSERRVLPDAKVRMLIVDREVALVSPEPYAVFADAPPLLTQHPGTVLSLCDLFEEYWRRALEHEVALRLGSTKVLTDRQVVVLDDVIAGHKSEDIAVRQLLSKRMVERIIGELFRHFGTEDRVSLVAEAVRLGWGFGNRPTWSQVS